MDAGAEADLPDDVMGKRVPQWILPPIDPNLSKAEREAEALRRKRMRPDILVMEGLEEKDIRGKSEAGIRTHIKNLCDTKQLKIHVVEVGYCNDLNHASKDADKRVQHEDLITLLRQAGLSVAFHDPVTLGRCGSIPKSLITLMKTTFGLESHRAEEYANKLNRHAVQWVDKMYIHRQCVLAGHG
jgi:hypothetical protein